MDTCSVCAAELSAGARYCSACGAAVVSAGAADDPFGATPPSGAPSPYDAPPHYGTPSPYGAPPSYGAPPYWQLPAADWRGPAATPYGAVTYGPASPGPAPLTGHWPPATPQPSATAPGIGVAGFILAVLGVFTTGVTSLVGLPLSVVGYVQARREGRPSGLCLAGIIISAVGIAILVATVILVLVTLAPLTEVTPNPYTY